MRLRRWLSALVLSCSLIPSTAQAIIITQPFPIVPHTLASGSQVQSDFSSLYNTVNGYLDASNFTNSSGIYASQIIPTNSSQATFGGSQPYFFSTPLTANGPFTGNSSITGNSTGFFVGQLTANNNLIVGTTASIGSSLLVGSGTTTHGLAVVGNSSVSGTTSLTGPLSANGGATTSALTDSGTASITGATTIGSTLVVTGGTTTAGLTNNGTATLNGNSTVTGTLGVSGGTTTAGVVSNGAATINGTLGVTGLSTTHGISDSSGVSTTGNFSFGNTSIGGTFNGSNGSSTITGPYQQSVGSTNYVHPFDANSISGSVKTHVEHGHVATATRSAGGCDIISVSFLTPFSSGDVPYVGLTVMTTFGNFFTIALNSTPTNTGFTYQYCNLSSGSVTYDIYWSALGE